MRNFNETEKISLLEEIDSIRSENIEQLFLMTKSSLYSYIKAILTYGIKNKITKDNLNVLKEFFKVVNEETRILNYIVSNIDDIDSDATIKFIQKLDDLNEKTFKYYYTVIEDIETSCETKVPHYAARITKNFKSLTDTISYRREVVALTETDKKIREQLDYEEDFWYYIDRIIKRVNTGIDVVNSVVYVKPIYDSDDLIGGIDMLIPEVVDLDTSLLAIELYQKAYSIYKSIGLKEVIKCDDEDFPIFYQDYYLDSKVSLIFKKRF